MNQKTLRMVLDIAMSVMLVFEMFIQYTGNFLHEVVGAAFFATIIGHMALSASWVRKTAQVAKQGKMTGRRTALAIMGILLAVTTVTLGISSIAISNLLYSAGFVWPLGTYAFWATVHAVSGYALCALVVVHLAMHWTFMASALHVPYNPSRRRAIGTCVHTAAAVGAIALGVAAAREALPQALANAQGADTSTTQTTDQGQASAFANVADKTGASETQTSSSASSASASSSSTSSSASSTGSKGKKNRSNTSSSTQSPATSQSSSSPFDAQPTVEEPTSSTPIVEEPASSANTSSSTIVTGNCTLCRKNCPLSSPRCNKPYEAGLI